MASCIPSPYDHPRGWATTEDRNQSADKLRELEQAAFEVRQQHEREWLGDLWHLTQRPPTAYSVAKPMEPNVSVTWRRGWIDAVRVGTLSYPIVNTLAWNPYSKLLGVLEIEQNILNNETFGTVGLSMLEKEGRLLNLRSLVLGVSERGIQASGHQIHYLFRSLPRIETLKLCVDSLSESPLFGGSYTHLHTIHLTYNNPRCRFYMLGYNAGLPNLRRLHLDTVSFMPLRGEIGSDREPITPGDLQSFFRSEHLKALEYFTFRNGEFADAGVEELLASGFVNRLKGLDLCRCSITDDGAQMLAAHPHVPLLEYLHLDGNLLSPIGIDALEAAGVQVSREQFFAQEDDEFVDEEDDGNELDPDGERDPDEVEF